MKFIIAGAGSVGYSIAKHLIKEGKDVVLIEKDSIRSKFLESDLDCIVLNKEINSIQTFKEADIQEGDFFIAATESDEINLIACSIASHWKNIKKVARIRNLDYSNAESLGKPFLGADYVISPEVEAAKQIADIIAKGAVSDILSFEGSDITMISGIVEKKSVFRNKSLSKIKKELNRQFIVALLKRDDKEIIPSGNTQIKEGDNIFIVADSATQEYILTRAGEKISKVKTALIIGSNRIGRNLLRILENKPIKITMIINNYEEAKEIAEMYPKVMVINGDVRDESIFEEEKLKEMDVIINVTDNQELNLLSALYAKSVGIKRAVATVSKSSYISIAGKLGIDATVSPKRSAIDAILKYIRKGLVKTFYSFFEGDAEAIEFVIPESCSAKGKSLKELKMPKDSIVVSVSRNSEVIIPDGEFRLLAGDTIIVVLKSNVVSKVESIFSDNNEF